ncbi:MAG: BREX-4 system phosphatase PglZ [Candidatus Hydrogenedens sp.]|jgi:hypothetical protein|nr:BREX-4 system phosphatase PglZ [Candidatus Hydrogenedens sp.]
MDIKTALQDYLNQELAQTFFLLVGDESYKEARLLLGDLHLEVLELSSFCSDEDRLPNLDVLENRIRSKDKPSCVVGLGEYLALQGKERAKKVLARLKDMNLEGGKCVLLLRGMESVARELKRDLRFDERRLCVLHNQCFDLSLIRTTPDVPLPASASFKALLRRLENGFSGDFTVQTCLSFPDSLVSIRQVKSAYEGIMMLCPDFRVAESAGDAEQWADLLSSISDKGGSLEAVFADENFDESLESGAYAAVSLSNTRAWLHFIALKNKTSPFTNSYLKYVIDNTTRFDALQNNILNMIIEIDPVADKRFACFKKERKSLLAKASEAEIAKFVRENKLDLKQGIFRLSDATRVERDEIIEQLVQQQSIPDCLPEIYPDLAVYLQKYHFQCGPLSEELTVYFENYKRQKVLNTLESDFLEKVNVLARERPYNRLPTRDELVDSLKGEGGILYWIDALGVEYLSFIADFARKNQLALEIRIGRAELPTITRLNRRFFEEWDESSRRAIKELDKVKHEVYLGYDYTKNEKPVHLGKELEIIRGVLDRINIELNQKKYKRCYIVSDHGASRLAVLKKQEEKYETKTQGQHSGRCCELTDFDDGIYDLPFATEENGYCILADYGRFKGSRAANVEVHGGASLEEVVVPVIELSLKDQTVVIRLLEDSVLVDFRLGVAISFVSDSPLKKPSVEVRETRYEAIKTGENQYLATLSDIKRVGAYDVDVFDNDTLISRLSFRVQSRSGNVKDDFDNLF